MKRSTKSILFIFSAFILAIRFSSAQSIEIFAPIQMDIPCVEAQYDLHIGSRDYALFGDVMKLQLFLYQNEIMYYPPTGYFGPITQNSLARYQSLRNLPATGVFDFGTRDTLAKETCGSSSLVPPSYYNAGQNMQGGNNVVDLNGLFGAGPTGQGGGQTGGAYNVSGGIFSN